MTIKMHYYIGVLVVLPKLKVRNCSNGSLPRNLVEEEVVNN